MPMLLGRPKAELVLSIEEHAQVSALAALLCQPYRAQTKGKAKRFIGYLRKSFNIRWQASSFLKDSRLIAIPRTPAWEAGCGSG
jgi:transposase